MCYVQYMFKTWSIQSEKYFEVLYKLSEKKLDLHFNERGIIDDLASH